MSDSDRQKYQDMLKKLEVEKINIYTDKDIDTIEKVIKKFYILTIIGVKV